jgi:hypothetical protein
VAVTYGEAVTDQDDIQALVDTFFAAFASGPGLDERMAGLRALFLDAAVVTVGSNGQPMSVDEFVTPRHALLAGDRLQGFREWEVSGRTEQFLAVAQHWCTYSKSWTEAGREHHGHGAKTLQLVRTGQGWRIAALAWDDHPD